MARPLTAYINTSAFIHNLGVVSTLCPHSKICVVIKAGAYGHGAINIAKLVETLNNHKIISLGVCSIDEALELREAGITMPIVLLEGIFGNEEIAIAKEKNLILVVHSKWQLNYLIKSWDKKDQPLWIKFNSGMNRLGFSYNETKSTLETLLSRNFNPIIMSHYASADSIDDSQVNSQFSLSNTIANSYKLTSSFGNSAAALFHKDKVGDIVRPGIMLYGTTPDNKRESPLALKAVMQLSSKVMVLHDIKKGETVGYGASWQATKDTRIAIIACGYADGYPREVSSKAYVSINNTKCSLVGRVSMDMMAVDVSNCQQVSIGTEVEIWGKNPTVNQVALWSNTVSYTILTSLNKRVKHSITTD